MTIDELKRCYPDANEETWHRHNGGWVHNSASVLADVPENALVGPWAKVHEGAVIGEGATVGERATVGRGAHWKHSPLYVVGTRHIVCIPSPGILKIGCMEHPIEWWEDHYKGVGRLEEYTVEQIEEYRAYIALARQWMKLHGCLENMTESHKDVMCTRFTAYTSEIDPSTSSPREEAQ